MQRLKDPQQKNLFQDPRTGIYYGRKYVNGREIERSLKTTNRHLAIQRWNQLLADWPKAQRDKTTLEEFATRIIKDVYAFKAKKTFQDIEGACRLHLFPQLGSTPLSELGGAWPYYKATQRRLTPKRKLWHDRKALRTILHSAAREGLIAAVPELALDPMDKTVKEGREITNAEIKKIIEAAPPKWKIKVELQLKTGMRSNERRHLKWADINFNTGEIRIGAVGDKTRRGRVLYADKTLLATLKRLRSNAASVYVFPNRADNTRPESEGQKSWQRLKKALKSDVKLHWLRHTTVTRAVRAGVDGSVVQRSLGMSDRVMKRVYHHVNEKDRRKLAEAVAKSMGDLG